MTLPTTPPRYSGWYALVSPITKDERFLKKYMSGEALYVAQHWRAFCVQKVVGTTPDGWWGDITEGRVRAWQSARGLTVDGIFGSKSQLKGLLEAADAVDYDVTFIPDRLLEGMIEGEGANVLAATNWYTPPGGLSGVDCGAIQWRQYGPPFSLSGLIAAFDPKTSVRHAADSLALRKAELKKIRADAIAAGKALTPFSSRNLLWYAVLAHNAPFLSYQVARNGKLSTPDAIAEWTVKTIDADGNVTSRYTHAEWAAHYPAVIGKYIDWNTV